MTLLSSTFAKMGSYSLVVAVSLPNGPPVAYSHDSSTLVLSIMNVNIFDFTNVTYVASDTPPAKATQTDIIPPSLCAVGRTIGNTWQPLTPVRPFPVISNELHPFYPITDTSQLQTIIPQVVAYVIQPTIRQFNTDLFNTTLYMPPLVSLKPLSSCCHPLLMTPLLLSVHAVRQHLLKQPVNNSSVLHT